jgi:hypothetical protein
MLVRSWKQESGSSPFGTTRRGPTHRTGNPRLVAAVQCGLDLLGIEQANASRRRMSRGDEWRPDLVHERDFALARAATERVIARRVIVAIRRRRAGLVPCVHIVPSVHKPLVLSYSGTVLCPEYMFWSSLLAVISGAEAALAADASNVPTKITAGITVTVWADDASAIDASLAPQ